VGLFGVKGFVFRPLDQVHMLCSLTREDILGLPAPIFLINEFRQ